MFFFFKGLTILFFLLSELREDNCPPPTYLVQGVKALISALRTWLKREVRVDRSVLTVISLRITCTWLCLEYLQSRWLSCFGLISLDVCQWTTTDFPLFKSPFWMRSVVDLQVTEPSSEVPDHIRPNHLIKELTKEIRYLEVRRDEEEERI